MMSFLGFWTDGGLDLKPRVKRRFPAGLFSMALISLLAVTAMGYTATGSFGVEHAYAQPFRRSVVTPRMESHPPDQPLPAAVQAGLGMSPCSIKVIGVGGGGGNTLNRMVEDGPGLERSALYAPRHTHL
jgi:hypothetical protein